MKRPVPPLIWPNQNFTTASAETILSKKIGVIDPPVNGIDVVNKAYLEGSITTNTYPKSVLYTSDPSGSIKGISRFTFNDITDTVLLDGSIDIISTSGSVNLSGGKITGLGTPIDPNDAATKDYVDTHSGGSGSATGPSLSVQYNSNGLFAGSSLFTFNETLGSLSIGSISIIGGGTGGGTDYSITGLSYPINDTDAATKAYVDAATGSAPGLPFNSVQFNSSGVFGGSADLTYDGQTFYISNTTPSTGTTDGALVVSGSVGIALNLNVGGELRAGSSTIASLDVTGDSTLASLAVTGLATMSSLVVGNASMDSLVVNTLDINGMATLEALAVTLDMQINGTTQSTDTSTGSLVVLGGVAIQKNLNIGDELVAGNSTLNSLFISDPIIGINVGGTTFTQNGDTNITGISGDMIFTNNANIYTRNDGFFSLQKVDETARVTIDLYGATSIFSTVESTTLGQGALIVDGGASVALNLNVGGEFRVGATTVASLDVSGNSVLIGTLSAGATTVASLDVSGNSVLVGTLSAGASTVASLDVSGNSVLVGTLVAGDSTLASLSVTGLATMSSLVVGEASMDSLVVNNLDINGMATLEALAVTLDMQINGTTQSTDTSTGSLVVLGGVAIQKNLNVGGNIGLQTDGARLYMGNGTTASSLGFNGTDTILNADVGAVSVVFGDNNNIFEVVSTNVLYTGFFNFSTETEVLNVNTTIATGTVTATNGATVGSLDVSGVAVLESTLSAGASTVASLNVTGNSVLTGTLSAGSSTLSSLTVTGVEYISSATDATDVSSGSLIVSGGVGIAKNLYVGNDVYATAFNATSDAILKTNIEHLTGSLDQLKRVEGYQYNWKDENMGEDIQYGVLAQQLEEAGLGNLVAKKGTHKSVNYLGLIPILIEAIKELSDKLDTKKDLF